MCLALSIADREVVLSAIRKLQTYVEDSPNAFFDILSDSSVIDSIVSVYSILDDQKIHTLSAKLCSSIVEMYVHRFRERIYWNLDSISQSSLFEILWYGSFLYMVILVVLMVAMFAFFVSIAERKKKPYIHLKCTLDFHDFVEILFLFQCVLFMYANNTILFMICNRSPSLVRLFCVHASLFRFVRIDNESLFLNDLQGEDAEGNFVSYLLHLARLLAPILFSSQNCPRLRELCHASSEWITLLDRSLFAIAEAVHRSFFSGSFYASSIDVHMDGWVGWSLLALMLPLFNFLSSESSALQSSPLETINQSSFHSGISRALDTLYQLFVDESVLIVVNSVFIAQFRQFIARHSDIFDLV